MKPFSSTISLYEPDMPQLQTVLPYLEKVHQSKYFSNFGPLELELRSRYSSVFGLPVEQLATCSNATQALTIASYGLNSSEWVIPNWTFTASGLSLLNNSSVDRIFLEDISSETWHLQFGKGTYASDVARMLVLPFGSPLSSDHLRNDSPTIIDAAGSLGNLQSLKDQSSQTIVVYSLHATKVLGCGEGAIIVFGNQDLAAEFRARTNFGFRGDRNSEISHSTNAKMSEIAAAYALASLDEFAKKIDHYQSLRSQVNELSIALGILPQAMNDLRIAPYWIVQFRDEETCNYASNFLKENGIPSRKWWPYPLSVQNAYASEGSRVVKFETPNSVTCAATCLGLPFYLGIQKELLLQIADTLDQVAP